MGREFQLPEQADSWGEFQARLEFEADAYRLTGVWWALGGLLFGLALVSSAYAFTDHHWWLWLCMLAALAADLALAVRAVDRADRERARKAELQRLQEAWQDHLDSASQPGSRPGRD